MKRQESLEKAREARASTVRTGFYSVQGRCQIPKVMAEQWVSQSSKSRGSAWLAGVRFQQEQTLLLAAIAKLAGKAYPSAIVHAEGVTLVMGDYIAEGCCWAEAVLSLLAQVMGDA